MNEKTLIFFCLFNFFNAILSIEVRTTYGSAPEFSIYNGNVSSSHDKIYSKPAISHDDFPFDGHDDSHHDHDGHEISNEIVLEIKKRKNHHSCSGNEWRLCQNDAHIKDCLSNYHHLAIEKVSFKHCDALCDLIKCSLPIILHSCNPCAIDQFHTFYNSRMLLCKFAFPNSCISHRRH